MLYSNRTLEPKEVIFDWGKLTALTMGEKGRGRCLTLVPCELFLEKGFNPNVDVVYSRNGKPKIVSDINSNNVFIWLTSAGGYTKRGDGQILVNNTNYVKLITHGYGADGAAGRIGQWSEALIQITANEEEVIFKIEYAGGRCKEFIRYHKGQFLKFESFESLELSDMVDTTKLKFCRIV